MCPIFLFLLREVSKVALFVQCAYAQCSCDSHNLANQGGKLQADLGSVENRTLRRTKSIRYTERRRVQIVRGRNLCAGKLSLISVPECSRSPESSDRVISPFASAALLSSDRLQSRRKRRRKLQISKHRRFADVSCRARLSHCQ